MAPGYAGDARAYAAKTQYLSLSPLWDLFEPHLAPGARVLDLGCGGGRDLAHFAGRGFRCIGLDRDTELARRAAAHAGVPVLQADVEALPLRDASFDAVWAVGLLHEMPSDARALVLGEISRVLKPGGLLLASLRLSLRFRPRGDTRAIHSTRPKEVTAALRHAGFIPAKLRADRVRSGPGEGLWLVALAQRDCPRDIGEDACSDRSPFTRFSSDDQ